jgi:Protein of unknown function, DUF488
VSSGRRSFDFLTAETSGKTPDLLLRPAVLPIVRVQALVDVRAAPTSRPTPLWNKGELESIVRRRGLEYVHCPDLGVPKEVRDRLHHGEMTYARFFAWYDAHVVTDAALDSLRAILPRYPLFLCTEIAPTYCHRHRLALKLENKSGWFPSTSDPTSSAGGTVTRPRVPETASVSGKHLGAAVGTPRTPQD